MATIYTRLNISMTEQPITPIIDMVQYDSGRGLDIMLTNDIAPDEPGESSSTLTANLYAVKPSGLDVVIPSLSVTFFSTSNAYEVKFASQNYFLDLLSEIGTVRCQVALRDLSDLVTTFEFYIKVHKNISREVEQEALLMARVASLENRHNQMLSGNSNAIAEVGDYDTLPEGNKTIEERVTDLETAMIDIMEGNTTVLVEEQ